MSARDRSDFPPHWDPPPRVGYGDRQPPILDVVETLLAMDAEPWAVDLFLVKLRSRAGHHYGRYYFFDGMDGERFNRYLAVLEQLPADSPIVTEWRGALEKQSTNEQFRTDAQRARLRALLERNTARDVPAVREDDSTPGRNIRIRPSEHSNE